MHFPKSRENLTNDLKKKKDAIQKKMNNQFSQNIIFNQIIWNIKLK
jgi:hypothetical protein